MPIYDDYRKFEDPTLSPGENIAKATGEGLSKGLSTGLQMLAKQRLKDLEDNKLMELLNGKDSFNKLNDKELARISNQFPNVANAYYKKKQLEQQSDLSQQKMFQQQELSKQRQANFERTEQGKQFDRNYKINADENKQFRKYMDKLSQDLLERQLSLNEMEDAVSSSGIGIKDRIADKLGLEWLKSEDAKRLETGLKTYFLSSIGTAGPRPNMYIEMQIRRMLPSIQNSKEGNLAIIKILRATAAIDRKKVEIYNRLAKEDRARLGFVGGDIQSRVEAELETFAMKQLADVAREVNPESQEFFDREPPEGYVRAVGFNGKDLGYIPENQAEKYREKGYLIYEDVLGEASNISQRSEAGANLAGQQQYSGNTPSKDVVTVVSPKGEIGEIPTKQLKIAQENGYKIYKSPVSAEQQAPTDQIPVNNPAEQQASVAPTSEVPVNNIPWDEIPQKLHYVLSASIGGDNSPDVINAFNQLSEQEQEQAEFWYNKLKSPQEQQTDTPEFQKFQQTPTQQQVSGSPGFQVLQQGMDKPPESVDSASGNVPVKPFTTPTPFGVPNPATVNAFNQSSKKPETPQKPDFIPFNKDQQQEIKEPETPQEALKEVFSMFGRFGGLAGEAFSTGALGAYGNFFDALGIQAKEMFQGEKNRFQVEKDAFIKMQDPGFKDLPFFERAYIINALNYGGSDTSIVGVNPEISTLPTQEDIREMMAPLLKKLNFDINPRNDFERKFIQKTASTAGSLLSMGITSPVQLAIYSAGSAIGYMAQEVTGSEKVGETVEIAYDMFLFARDFKKTYQSVKKAIKRNKLLKSLKNTKFYTQASANVKKSTENINKISSQLNKAKKAGASEKTIKRLEGFLEKERAIFGENNNIIKTAEKAVKNGDPSQFENLAKSYEEKAKKQFEELVEASKHQQELKLSETKDLNKQDNITNVSKKISESPFGNVRSAKEASNLLQDKTTAEIFSDGLAARGWGDDTQKLVNKSVKNPKYRVYLNPEQYAAAQSVAKNQMKIVQELAEKVGDLNPEQIKNLRNNLENYLKQLKGSPVELKSKNQAINNLEDILEKWFSPKTKGKSPVNKMAETLKTPNNVEPGKPKNLMSTNQKDVYFNFGKDVPSETIVEELASKPKSPLPASEKPPNIPKKEAPYKAELPDGTEVIFNHGKRPARAEKAVDFSEEDKNKLSMSQIVEAYRALNESVNWTASGSKPSAEIKNIFKKTMKDVNPAFTQIFDDTNKYYTAFSNVGIRETVEVLAKDKRVIKDALKNGITPAEQAQKIVDGTAKPTRSLLANSGKVIEKSFIIGGLLHGNYLLVAEYLTAKVGVKAAQKITAAIADSPTYKKILPKLKKLVEEKNERQVQRLLSYFIKQLEKENPDIDFKSLNIFQEESQDYFGFLKDIKKKRENK